ncbi:MAG: hypothetical protein HS116_15785 [Planctomycetes bacterium]|nr:hypothetical protein [Planctomycetota bacterium]
MPKEKKKIVLPKVEEVPTAKPIADEVKEWTDKAAKARTGATKDGKFNKYDPKYRTAQKHLKRAQRKLKKELYRQRALAAKPAEAEAKAE